jgi:hypothetical protein|tara:strand:- start:459 stop:611 length:153 start_codon:yes stop_codon:yes gene_type:complete
VNKQIRIKICLLLINLKKEKERKLTVLEQGWQRGLVVGFWPLAEKNKGKN